MKLSRRTATYGFVGRTLSHSKKGSNEATKNKMKNKMPFLPTETVYRHRISSQANGYISEMASDE